MITVTITGDNADQIVNEVRRLFGPSPIVHSKSANTDGIVDVSEAPVNLAAPKNSSAPAQQEAPDEVPPRHNSKRGRPKGSKNSTAAASAEAQPAVADNTGSATSGFILSPAAPTEAPAQTSGPLSLAPTPAPAAGPSNEEQVKAYDAMRAKLQQIVSDDPTNGLRTVHEILAKVGVTKIKEVAPENYAAVTADADAAISKRVASVLS